MDHAAPDYAGFWIRVVASIIDSVLSLLVLVPLFAMFFGPRYFVDESAQSHLGTLLEIALPAVAVFLFWQARQATPGKLWLNMRIVDAASGGKPTTAQWIIRYVGYYVSMIPLFLGFAWVGFDARKQGWHDKLANTVVIRTHGATDDGAVRFTGDPKKP